MRMRDICSLFDSKLTPFVYDSITKLLKTPSNKEKLNNHILNKKDLYKKIISLRDVGEMQRILLLMHKVCSMNSLKAKNIVEQHTEEFIKIKPRRFNIDIKDLLFKINLNNKTVPSFLCRKLELPTRLYNNFSTKIYMFLNENSIKFYIDKEIIVIKYDSIQNYKQIKDCIEIKTINKIAKVFMQNKDLDIKNIFEFIEERKKEFSKVYEKRNFDTGFSLQFLSSYKTDDDNLSAISRRNSSFLDNLDFQSSENENNQKISSEIPTPISMNKIDLTKLKSTVNNTNNRNIQKNDENKTIKENNKIKENKKNVEKNVKKIVNNLLETKSSSENINVKSETKENVQEIIDSLTIYKEKTPKIKKRKQNFFKAKKDNIIKTKAKKAKKTKTIKYKAKSNKKENLKANKEISNLIKLYMKSEEKICKNYIKELLKDRKQKYLTLMKEITEHQKQSKLLNLFN